MKKQLIMIGIVVILVTVGLNGCIDSISITSKVNREKILGRWIGTIPNTSIMVIMNFFTNESYYESINETETVLWGTYKITDETLILQSVEATKPTTYKYVFSNGNNTLSLRVTEVEGVDLVFTRQ